MNSLNTSNSPVLSGISYIPVSLRVVRLQTDCNGKGYKTLCLTAYPLNKKEKENSVYNHLELRRSVDKPLSLLHMQVKMTVYPGTHSANNIMFFPMLCLQATFVIWNLRGERICLPFNPTLSTRPNVNIQINMQPTLRWSLPSQFVYHKSLLYYRIGIKQWHRQALIHHQLEYFVPSKTTSPFPSPLSIGPKNSEAACSFVTSASQLLISV